MVVKYCLHTIGTTKAVRYTERRGGRKTQNRRFLSTILNGNAVGTKVSVRHRQGGHSSKVVVKRGSTVHGIIHMDSGCFYHMNIM